MNCNLLLSRYSKARQSFIKNQEKLNKLVRQSETDAVVKIEECTDDFEEFQIEWIEPVDVKIETEDSKDGDKIEEETEFEEVLNEIEEIPKRRKPIAPVKRVNGKHYCDKCNFKTSV